MTLLECIDTFISNIRVTDRQEDNIKNSYVNLEGYLLNAEYLAVEEVFLNGSYDRGTIIRPLEDIDLFAILNLDEYKDEFGQLPNPQSVLSKLKNYLDNLHDYKGKVTQDRPCVTVRLSDKDFDVLPCFDAGVMGFYIPNYNLESWTNTDPRGHTKRLAEVDNLRGGKVVSTIQAVKYWNRDLEKTIPSYHIEEIAIQIFNVHNPLNMEEAIWLWFDKASEYMDSSKFSTINKFEIASENLGLTKETLTQARDLHFNQNDESGAIAIWKEVFGREFPTINVNEAKEYGKMLSEGSLKISAAGTLSSTSGQSVPKSSGFFGE